MVELEAFAPEWEVEPEPFYQRAIPYPAQARKWLKDLMGEYERKGIVRRAQVTGPGRPREVANVVLVAEGQTG